MKSFCKYLLLFFVILPLTCFAVGGTSEEKEDVYRSRQDSKRGDEDVEKGKDKIPHIANPVLYSGAYFERIYEDHWVKEAIGAVLNWGTEESTAGDMEAAFRGLDHRRRQLHHVMGLSEKKWINWTAAVSAVGTAGMFTIMLMNNGVVAYTLGVPVTYDSWNIPEQNLIFGSIVGGLSVPPFFWSNLQMFKNLALPIPDERKSTEYGHHSPRTYILSALLVAVFEIYSFYTYGTVNFVDAQYTTYAKGIETAFKVFAIIGGVPWALNQIRTAFARVFELYDTCKRYGRRYKKGKRFAEKARCDLLDILEAAAYKAMYEPRHALSTWHEINAYIKSVEAPIAQLQGEIADIESGTSREVDEDGVAMGDMDAQSSKRRAEMLASKRTDIKILQQKLSETIVKLLVHSVDPKNDDMMYMPYPTYKDTLSARCSQRFLGDGTTCNKAGRIVGLGVTGMAATSLLYQGLEIAKEIGFGNGTVPTNNESWWLTPEEQAVYGAGGALTAFYVPYFAGTTMYSTGELFDAWVGHQSVGLDYVDLHYEALRGVTSTFIALQSTGIMMPFAFIGGEGMAEGIGSLFPSMLPWETQFWTLIPAMAVWGLYEYKLVQKYYQRVISSIFNAVRKWRRRNLAAEFTRVEVAETVYSSLDIENLQERLDAANAEARRKHIFEANEESPDKVERLIALHKRLTTMLKKLRKTSERSAQQRLLNLIQEVRRWIDVLKPDIVEQLGARVEHEPVRRFGNAFIRPIDGDEESEDGSPRQPEPLDGGEAAEPTTWWGKFKARVSECFGRKSIRAMRRRAAAERVRIAKRSRLRVAATTDGVAVDEEALLRQDDTKVAEPTTETYGSTDRSGPRLAESKFETKDDMDGRDGSGEDDGEPVVSSLLDDSSSDSDEDERDRRAAVAGTSLVDGSTTGYTREDVLERDAELPDIFRGTNIDYAFDRKVRYLRGVDMVRERIEEIPDWAIECSMESQRTYLENIDNGMPIPEAADILLNARDRMLNQRGDYY